MVKTLYFLGKSLIKPRSVRILELHTDIFTENQVLNEAKQVKYTLARAMNSA